MSCVFCIFWHDVCWCIIKLKIRSPVQSYSGVFPVLWMCLHYAVTVCFQSVGDVLQERFAVEMKCNTALRLAALHMHERLDSCGQTRASIKSITWVICVCVCMSLKGHTGRRLLPWLQRSSLEVLWDFDRREVWACCTAAITVICEDKGACWMP